MNFKPIEPEIASKFAKGEWTGWGFTDSYAVHCPKCGALSGYYCSTPKGRTAPEPHWQRGKVLNDSGYTANRIQL
jgi:hypothetical protein